MADDNVTIAAKTIPWYGPTSGVELWVYSTKPWVTAAGTPINASSPYDGTKLQPYKKLACTINGGAHTCAIEAKALSSTEDAIVNNDVTLIAVFMDTTYSTPRLINGYSVFGGTNSPSAFRVPDDPTSTTWANLATHFAGAVPPAPAYDVDINGDLSWSGVATGDGTGITNTDARKLRGRNVGGGAPSNGQVLGWNSTSVQWEPQAAGATVSGGNATQLQSRAVSATAPSGGQGLVWSVSNLAWEPGTVSVFFDVKTFGGAVGDGTANDTTAIQSTIDACGAAGGGVVFFPPGTYKVTALTVEDNYVRLQGCGWASRIAKSTATGTTLLFDNGGTGITAAEDGTYLTGCGVENVRFEPLVTRTSGAEIVAYRYNKIHLDNLVINNVYQGIQLGRASDLGITAYIRSLRIRQMFLGVKAVNAIEVYGHGWALDQYTVAAGAIGIYVSGGCEGFNLLDADVVNSWPALNAGAVGANSYTLYIDNDAGTSTVARFNKFTDCFFDGGAFGAYLADGEFNSFINCWFHGWTDGGLVISGDAANTHVVGGEAVRCGTIGLFIDSTGHGTFVENFSSINSGVSSANAGIHLGTGASHVTLSHCRSGTVTNILGNGQQNYGLSIVSGVTHVKVLGCDFRGNNTGAYNILATSETNIYQNNTTEFGVGDYVRAYRSTNQSIPNFGGTATALSFDTDTSDPNSMHDTAGNPDKFVALTPGVFSAKATVQFAASGTGRRQLAAVRYDSGGGGAVAVDIATEESPAAGAATILNLSGVEFYMSYGQYVRIEVIQSSGGALNAETAGTYAPAVSVVKVR